MSIIDLTGIDCVAYVRVSTEAQAGEKQTSLADQQAAVYALAGKLGRSVGHVFEDAGYSGATMDQRPAMQSLVESCVAAPRTKKHPGYVVVLNDSRWGRFPDSEESTYWRVHLAKRGWIVRFAEGDDVQDKTLRPVLRAMSQTQATLYRDALKANVLRGTRGTAEQGYWQAQAPVGYQRKVVFPAGRERIVPNDVPKAKDEKVILVPHPTEAAIVRELYARYIRGTESLRSLVDWVVTADRSRKWSKAAVRRVLTNPVYMGDIVWGRLSNDRDELGHRVVRSDVELYGKANAHEALVSRDVFAAAQARMAINKRATKGVRSDWILSGIVRCRCGKSFAAGGMSGVVRATGRQLPPVYRCTTRGHHTAARCPYPGTVAKHLLEASVLGTLSEIIGTAVHRRQMAAALDREAQKAKQAARTVEHIDRDLKAARDKQQRLVDAIASGAISTLDARERMQALRADVLALTAERERVERTANRAALPADQRDQLVLLAMDFRAAAETLTGPALRELIRPWIKEAHFNTETRELTITIRRVPASSSGFDTDGVGSGSKPRSEPTVTRVVRVGGSAV